MIKEGDNDDNVDESIGKDDDIDGDGVMIAIDLSQLIRNSIKLINSRKNSDC